MITKAQIDKLENLPPYDESIVCDTPECKAIEATVMTGLYGVAGGGGPGAYTMCENCGVVLSKTCDGEAIGDDNEPTEIKTADVQSASDDKPRGDEG